MHEENTITRTVLVVEDNPLNMKLIADLLTLNGFSVLKAVNGESALSILKDAVPGLILLDLRLPDINGFEVFRRIRNDTRLDSVKVVALTASVLEEREQKMLESEFDGLISKPIDTKEFVRTITALFS